MGFFANLFKKKDARSTESFRDIQVDNPECRKLGDLKKYMSKLKDSLFREREC